MTKRSAGSDSVHETPLKKCRLGTDTRLQAVHAPPLHTNINTRQQRRKRASSSDEDSNHHHHHHHQPQRRDEEEEEEEEEEQRPCKKALSGATGLCPRLLVTSLTSNKGPTEQNREAMPSEEIEQLSEFNSFQFWRTPLPDLDLSLLDDVSSAAEVSAADSSLKNIPEAMET